MFSGSNGFGALSKEVIPIIDEYPQVWKWLKDMHQCPSLVDYPYMFSKCDTNVVQRTGESKIGSVVPDNIIGQVTYWFGLLFMVTWWPLTLLALIGMLGTRMWKAKGRYIDEKFQFKFQKKE